MKKNLRNVIIALVFSICISFFLGKTERKLFRLSRASYSYIKSESFYSKSDLAKILGKRHSPTNTSEKILIPDFENPTKQESVTVEYSVDMALQQQIAQLLKRGRVPYGAFIAMDAKTGQILAMVSHGIPKENLTLRSSFPVASVFKVVTAAAAVEKGFLSHNSMIPVRGGFHTLLKRNLFSAWGMNTEDAPRFARLISFQDALAKSVNSVFGKVGIFKLGAVSLREIASRFHFDQTIPFEMPVDSSQVRIPDDEFGIAESASGYTRLNTMSPIHGAMIAASIINDGVMVEPSMVTKVTDSQGTVLYSFKPKVLSQVVDKKTAEELATMMRRTVTDGTSRWAFYGMERSLSLAGVAVGGKTGTLNGNSPPGRYDWFVGFGSKKGRKIAFASLCIHSSRHGIKASQIARSALETIFNPLIALKNVPKNIISANYRE